MTPRVLCAILLIAAVCLFSLSGIRAYAQELPSSGAAKPDRDAPFPAPTDALSGAEAGASDETQAVAGVGQWSRFAFQSFRSGNWEIYLADGDGGAPRNLSQHGAADARPRLNLGATRVAFNSDRDGNAEIYTVNTDGTGLARLTFNSKAADFAPAWSPDGSRIVFVSDRTGNNELWVMNADGSSPVQLTNQKDSDTSPVWSPDGQWIAAKRTAEGLSTVYLIRPDGSGLAPQVERLRYVGDLTWSPDSSTLLTDADIDGNYWNELIRIRYFQWGRWEAELVLDANRTFVDLWAGAFAPDYSAVAFTMVQYAVKNRQLVVQRSDLLRGELSSGEISVMAGSGRDMNPSWQNADLSAPASHVEPLPEYLQAGRTPIRLAGADAGPSGISSYDVQYALAPEGPWLPLANSLAATETYLPDVEPGARIWLRSRATDYAGNVEAWPPAADAGTQLYSWAADVRGVDSRGTPIPHGSLTSTPDALTSVARSLGARQNLYAVAQSYSLSMAAQGYGAVAPTTLNLNADADLDLFLPPAVELIQNGGFEEDFTGWTGEGTVAEGAVADGSHSGNHGLLLGSTCMLRCAEGPIPIGLPTNNWTAHTIDSQGNLYILQAVVPAESGQLRYTMRSFAAKEWSEPEIVGTVTLPAGGHNRAPSIAVDGKGVVYVGVVTHNPEGPATKENAFWYAQKEPGGGWTPFTQLAQDVDYIGDRVIMAGDPESGLHVLVKSRFYYRLTAQGQWTAGLDINPANSNPLVDATMAIDEHGVAHFLTWLNDSPIYRTASREGVLSVPVSLGNVLVYNNSIGLAVHSSGAIHAILGRGYLHRTGGGFWTQPGLVPEDGEFTPSEVALQIDAAGRAYVFGQSSYYSPPVMVVKTVDAGWSSPQRLNATGYLYPNQFTLTSTGVAQFLSFSADGSEYVYWASPLGVTGVISSASQVVTLTAQMVHPTLSFFHTAISGDPEGRAQLSVQIDEGLGATQVLSTPAAAAWTQGWVDMEPWLGKTVTVTFSVEQADAEPLLSVYLDDVSLGPWTTPVINEVTPAQVDNGWDGSEISVRGDNFTPGSALSLGDAPLSGITFVDEHTLHALVPAGLPAGHYDLWVKNPDGQQNAAIGGFTLGAWSYLPVVRK